MDNTNITFVGYSSDGTMKQALKNRKYNINLEDFYNAVNTTGSGCSCCKQEDVNVYAVQPVGIPQIKPSILSICSDCLQSLPIELTVINLDSHGAPPLLIDRTYESEV